MSLCIYERSLFPMHSYLCGRNLDIYVTVANRYSNLSWMISQWYCWSWDMHRLVPIYLPTHLFYCFCLKSSPNVNLQMKRDIKLQEYLTRKKGKRCKMKCMMPKKPKANSSNWNIKNFRHRSYNEMYWCIWSQMKSFKVVLSSYAGGHICIFL